MAINNQPTIEPRTVTGIFTRYIAKTLPLAFDESMSYYECLCGLLEYINEDIVTDINNVNDGLSELQTFYLQLQTYVNNYFDNIDVQDEINKKLDAMSIDGTLTQLIGNYIDPLFNTFKSNIESQVNEIDNKVDAVASGSPLVASSTSEMTETDRVYVNTTDGNWYYYDGDSWEIGGTYQSTGISDGYIMQPMLSESLQSTINTKTPTLTINSGQYRNSSANLATLTAGRYTDPIELKFGETIYFKCKAGTSVTVICRVNDDNTKFLNANYAVLVSGTSSNMTEYSYTAIADMKISLSYIEEYDYCYISNVNNEILNNEILDNFINLDNKTIVKNNGYYINANHNTISSNSQIFYSDPILIKKGETINVLGSAIDSMSVITKCDEDGSNRQILVVGTGLHDTYDIYQYRANSDMYVMISSYIGYYVGCYTYQYLNEIKDNNLFDSFLNVGCIGDSLASGESAYKTSGETHYIDLYQYSWPQYIAKMTGNTYYNFSKGGLTAKTWLSDAKGASLAFDGNHECECYIIGLGENDKNAGSEGVGTSSDIDLTDYTNNADTFYGNYGKIIQMCQEHQPKCKIFLLKIPRSSEVIDLYNAAITTMASMFDNVYLIDITDSVSSGFLNSQKRGGHYNAIGYKFIANALYQAFNDFMESNNSEFSQIEFIGTDYSWS